MTARPAIDFRDLADTLARQEILARQCADDVAAARAVVDALNRINALDFTPIVAAQIAAALSGRISRSSWSHFDGVEHATQELDNASDLLESA